MKVLDSEVTSARFSDDPRWQLAQRVAASQFFARGPKLRAFLLYVCEGALEGRSQELTAQVIGSRVFGRGEDYIPSEDNIVRVEARELRKRLVAYFESDGRDEPVVIDIPKGSYTPVFVERPQVAIETPLLLQTEAVSIAAPSPRPRWLVPVLSGALLAAIALLIWQVTASPFRTQERAYLAGLRESPDSAVDFAIYRDLLGHLGLRNRGDALLVLSNPWVMNYSVSSSADVPQANKSDVTVRVPKELKGSFASILKETDREQPYQFFRVTRESYTGIGEAVAAFHLGRLMDLVGRRSRLTQGRFLNWDHIDRQDLILLGGPQSNNWTFEKDAKSNFTIDGSSILNDKPRSGEQARYDSSASTDYALIQKLTTPYNFETLLIAGVTSAGTAAAGELLADPKRMASVYHELQSSSAARKFPPDWEILIRVAIRDGLPLESSVIAVRPMRSVPAR